MQKFGDIELATWLLFNSDVDLDLEALKKKTEGFLAESGTSLEDALELIIKSLTLAFYPLRFVLSKTEHTIKNNPIFDQLWMTHIVSVVSKCIKEDSQKIMRMPLAVCYLYYVDYLRQQQSNLVARLTDEDIKKDIDLRTCELVVDYLIKKNIININDRNTILTSLTKDHKER